MADFGGFEIEDDEKKPSSPSAFGGFEIEDGDEGASDGKTPVASAEASTPKSPAPTVASPEPEAPPASTWKSGDGGEPTLPVGEKNQWGVRGESARRKRDARLAEEMKEWGRDAEAIKGYRERTKTAQVAPELFLTGDLLEDADGNAIRPGDAIAVYHKEGDGPFTGEAGQAARLMEFTGVSDDGKPVFKETEGVSSEGAMVAGKLHVRDEDFDRMMGKGEGKAERSPFEQVRLGALAETGDRRRYTDDMLGTAKAVYDRLMPYAGRMAPNEQRERTRHLSNIYEGKLDGYEGRTEAEKYRDAARKAGLEPWNPLESLHPDEDDAEFMGRIQHDAGEELRLDAIAKLDAGGKLSATEQSVLDKIVKGGIESGGYALEFALPGGAMFKGAQALSWGAKAVRAATMLGSAVPVVAAESMSRYQEYITPEYGFDDSGEFRMVAAPDNEEEAAYKAIGGAAFDTGVEVGLEAATMGLLRLAGKPAGWLLGKATPGAVKEWGAKKFNRFMASETGQALRQINRAYQDFSAMTQINSPLGELAEENVQAFEKVIGLDGKSSEYNGLAKEWQDFKDNQLNWKTQWDIFYGLVAQLAIGSAKSASEGIAQHISSTDVRRDIRMALKRSRISDETISTLTPEQQKTLDHMWRHYSSNPDELKAKVKNLGISMRLAADELLSRESSKMAADLKRSGIEPEKFVIQTGEDGKLAFRKMMRFGSDGSKVPMNAMTDAAHGVTIVDQGNGTFHVMNDWRGLDAVPAYSFKEAQKKADEEVLRNQRKEADNKIAAQRLMELTDPENGPYRGRKVVSIPSEAALRWQVAQAVHDGKEILGITRADQLFKADGSLKQPGAGGFHTPDGHIVVILDNVPSPAEMERVLAHEATGHEGVESATGRGANTVEFIQNAQAEGFSKFVLAEQERAVQRFVAAGMDEATARMQVAAAMSTDEYAREAMARYAQGRLHQPTWYERRKHELNQRRRDAGENVPIDQSDLEVMLAEAEAKGAQGENELETLPGDSGVRYEEGATDEARNGADEAQPQPEQGEERGQEAPRPEAGTEPGAQAPDAGVVEPSKSDNGGQNLNAAESSVPADTIGGDAGRQPMSESSFWNVMHRKGERRRVPVDEIKIPDTQFKENADPKTGVVKGQELGEYYENAENPIAIYERKDGTMEIVTGRHRLDAAKRSGWKDIDARIFREADGYTPEDMRLYDAVANILDEKGTVKDYVRFFDESGFSDEDAKSSGILNRQKGRMAFGIVQNATDDTRGAIYWNGTGGDGLISAEQAAIIADAAPKQAALQRILVRRALDGVRGKKLAILARSLAEEAKNRKNAPKADSGTQLDLFTSEEDVALLQQEEKRADYRAKKANEYKRIAENLRTAMRKGGRLDLNKDYAKELGISDPKEKAQLAAARDKAVERANYWENAIRLDDADKAQMDSDLGIAPKLSLESVTAEQITAENKKRAEKEAIKKRQEAPLKGGGAVNVQPEMDLGQTGQQDLFSPIAEKPTPSDNRMARAKAAADRHVVVYGNGQKGTLADLIKNGGATLYPEKGLTVFDKGKPHVVTIGFQQFTPTKDELPYLVQLQKDYDAAHPDDVPPSQRKEPAKTAPASAPSAKGTTTPPKSADAPQGGKSAEYATQAAWPNGWEHGKSLDGYAKATDADISGLKPGDEVAVAHTSGGASGAKQAIFATVRSVGEEYDGAANADIFIGDYKDGVGYDQDARFKKSEIVGIKRSAPVRESRTTEKSSQVAAPKSSAPTTARTPATSAFKRGDRVFLKGAKDGQRVTFLKANADGTADVQVRTPGANRYAPEKVETRTVPMGDISATGMKDTLTDAERKRLAEGMKAQAALSIRMKDEAAEKIARQQEDDLAALFDTPELAEEDYSNAEAVALNFDTPELAGVNVRTKAPPKKTGIGYKVFVRGKDGGLYPPMVANPNGAATPVGVWIDASEGVRAEQSKTGRDKVKAGGKGTNGGSGSLAWRPGWHLGEIPYALQFNVGPKVPNPLGIKNAKGEVIKIGEFFPGNFVWAEVEYAADVDYQDEAMSYGRTPSGKFNHALAGLPRLPVDGSYKYRTNANPATDPWIITGSMKVNRVLTDDEVDAIVRRAGREPQKRESEVVQKFLAWAKKWKLDPSKQKVRDEWANRNGVSFDTPEFDPDMFQKRVGAVAKLVKTYKDSGVADFKTLATRMAERFPDKFGAMKPYLRGVWNAVAEQMDLDEVSKPQADEFYAGIEKPKAQTGEVSSPETAAPEAPKPPPANKLQSTRISDAADEIADLIERGEKFTRKDVTDIVERQLGGKVANGDFDAKQVTDILELGVNKWITRQSYDGKGGLYFAPNGDAKAAVAKIQGLRDILALIPTQTTRSVEQDKMQQFSTPPTEAFAAAWVANITDNDVMLEPSAGIGGIAVFGANAGAKVVLNELSPRRAEILEQLGIGKPFEHNAENLYAFLEPDIKAGRVKRPTVVVMNPPFSNSQRTDKKNTHIGADHVEQALKLLAPGGRLVAIVGNGMAHGRPAFKAWWDRIGREYTVRANIGVNGQEYAKYGTTFDNNIIVIDKVAPNGSIAPIYGTIESLDELPALLEGVRNDRPKIENRKLDTRADERVEQQTVRPEPPRPERSVLRPGRNGNGSAQPDGRRASVGVRGNDEGQRERGESDGRGDRGPSGQPALDALPVADGLTVQSVEQTREVGDGTFSEYKPSKVSIPGMKPHPTALVESSAMASVQPPNPTYSPKIPKQIVEDGVLSEAQIEQVVYAGQAHEQTLGNGERKGYFIGDGTGVGKGREISGIILDNFNNERRKAVWISLNGDLADSAKRDLEPFGLDGEFFELDTKKRGLPSLPGRKTGVAFTTYSSLSQYHAGINRNGDIVSEPKAGPLGSRFSRLVKWLGGDFDGVIAFDEVHAAANAVSKKGKRGNSKPSARALAVLDLQRMLPNARILYVSATGATEVSNLAYATRLGLWGKGTAFKDREAFINQVSAGGLSVMEIVARDMKAMGVYMARNLSFEGVENDRVTHELSPDQVKQYNLFADTWQMVMGEIENALISSGGIHGKANGGAKSAFWGAHQRFFNQVLSAAQMPSVLKKAHEMWDAGYSPVFQLVTTSEAQMKKAMEEARKLGLGGEIDIENLDLSPRSILIGFVQQSFPTVQYVEEETESGKTHWIPLKDKNGNYVHDPAAVERKERLIGRLQRMKLGESPIDMILNEFGYENVAEITGRSRRREMVRNSDGEMEMKLVPRTVQKRKQEVADFTSGKRTVLVFSKAGSTGASYHANRDFKNQRRRVHFLIEAGYNAADAIQGLGRTHRSNESSHPLYELCSTNLPGHKRFMSTIARRLAQLGSLTAGDRSSSGSGVFSEADNLENQYAKNAVVDIFEEMFQFDPEKFNRICTEMGFMKARVNSKTGEREYVNTLINEDGEFDPKEELDIPHFLNRILAMKIDAQNELFDEFSKRMAEDIERARENGTFDPGMEKLKGITVEVKNRTRLWEDAQKIGTTDIVEVGVTKKSRKTDYAKAKSQLEYYAAAGAVPRVYTHNGSGDVLMMVETKQTKTMKDGSIVTLFRRLKPNGEADNTTETAVEKNYTQVLRDEEGVWTRAYEATPDLIEQSRFFANGTLLPIWDRLNAQNPRFYKIVPTGGAETQTFLGMEIAPDNVENVLARFGKFVGSVEVTPDVLLNRIMKDGRKVELQNGWTLKRVKVLGDNRIEIDGVDEDADVMRLAREPFAYSEKIGYLRVFVKPNAESLRDFLAEYPAVPDKGGLATASGAAQDLSGDKYKAPLRAFWSRIESATPAEATALGEQMRGFIVRLSSEQLGEIFDDYAALDNDSLSAAHVVRRMALDELVARGALDWRRRQQAESESPGGDIVNFDTPELSPVTPAEDAAYMDAVRRGDMETAQRMVLDAARRKGGKYYRATSKELAPEGGVPWMMFVEEGAANEDSVTGPLYGERGNYGDHLFVATDRDSVDLDDIIKSKKFNKAAKEFYGDDVEVTPENFNPSDIVDSAGMFDDPDFIQKLYDDGVIDGSVKAIRTNDGLVVMGDSRSVPGLVKSLDPVTYDDAGNVIPLSQRFNRRNEDIRFDTPELTPAEADYAASGDKTPTEKVMREVYGMTNDEIATALRASGMEPPAHVKKSDEVKWRQAEVILSNPTYMAKLSRAAAKFPRPLRDFEIDALDVLFRERQNAVNAAQSEVDDWKQTLDSIADGEVGAAEKKEDARKNLAAAQSGLARAKALMLETGKAKIGGASEQGRGLRANRGSLYQDDLTYAGITGEIAQIVGGADRITPEMDAQIRDLAKLFGDLDAAGRRIATERAKPIVEKIIAQTKNGLKVRKATERRFGDEAKRVARNYENALIQIEVGAVETGGTLIGMTDKMHDGWRKWLNALGEFHCFENPDITEEEVVNAILDDISPFMDGVDADQVRDVISNLGHNYKMSRYDSQRLMNSLRNISRYKRQIDWMDETNTMPPATGPIRDEPTQDEREWAKKVRERKAEVPDAGRDERRLKGVLDSIKKRLENRIEELKRAVETGERIPAPKRKVVDDIRVRELRAEKDEWQKRYDELFGTTRTLTPEQKIAMAEKTLNRMLEADLVDLDRARQGDFSKVEGRPAVTEQYIRRLERQVEKGYKTDSPALQTLRERRIETLKAIFELKKAKYEFGMTPEEIEALNARKITNREKAVARLAERVATGDIRTGKPQPPMTKDQQKRYDELGEQMKRGRQKLAELRLEAENATVPTFVRKGVNFLRFVTTAQRALRATMDFSAVLRQAARMTLGHPVKAARAFGKAWTAARSEASLQDVNEEILSDPIVQEAVKKFGLHLREVDAQSDRDVEMFHGMERNKVKIFGKEYAITDIPLFGEFMLKSERHYLTYLNAMSADLYTSIVNGIPGGATPWQKKMIADMINIWNGSAALSKERRQALQKAWVNDIFWAPQLAISRVQSAVGYDIWHPLVAKGIKNADGSFDKVSNDERKTAAKIGLREHMRSTIAMRAIGALLKWLFSDDDDKYNFSQADWFEKMMMLVSPKIGNTTIDLTGGESTFDKLVHQLATKSKRTGTGRLQKFGEFNGPSTWGAIGRYLQGKLSPSVSTVTALWEGKDYVGDEYDAGKMVREMLVPLTFEDVKDQIVQNGVGKSLVTVPLSVLGAGGSTYDRKPYENAVNRFLEAEKEYSDYAKDESLGESDRKAILDELKASNPLLADGVRQRLIVHRKDGNAGLIPNAQKVERQLKKLQADPNASKSAIAEAERLYHKTREDVMKFIRENRWKKPSGAPAAP